MGWKNWNRECVNRCKTLEINLIIEAVVRRCSVKHVFLKISQNSQANICARCEIFKNTFLTEHLSTTASAIIIITIIIIIMNIIIIIIIKEGRI